MKFIALSLSWPKSLLYISSISAPKSRMWPYCEHEYCSGDFMKPARSTQKSHGRAEEEEIRGRRRGTVWLEVFILDEEEEEERLDT